MASNDSCKATKQQTAVEILVSHSPSFLNFCIMKTKKKEKYIKKREKYFFEC